MSIRKLMNLFIVGCFVLTFAGEAAVFGEGAEKKPEYVTKSGCEGDKTTLTYNEEGTTGDCTGTVPTPEPVSIILFSAGLAGVGFAARRRLRRSES